MIAGTLGGMLTTWVTFVPCFLWIFLGAPFVEGLRGNRALDGALAAITAAVVGVILNLAIWFALHVLFTEVNERRVLDITLDVPEPSSLRVASLILTTGAVLAVFRFKAGMIATLVACASVGVAYHLLGGSV
jgi:chromate transporter